MSQFDAATRNVKPGFDGKPARLFENYPRPDSFVITGHHGSQTSAPLATAAFRKDHHTPFRDFFLPHSMRCLPAQPHDQPAAAVTKTRADR
jgi:hypothetical protein